MREGIQTEQPGTGATSALRSEAGATAAVILVVLAALVGIALLVDSLWRSSPTYDEVTYLQLGCHWWRTGDQTQAARSGFPVTFWKLQQVPILWILDRLGKGDWIDDPARHEPGLLMLARLSSLWIWLAAWGLVVYWSRRLYGAWAMVLAGWWFVMSPNLLAHGALATTETPVVALMTAMSLLFWVFLCTADRRAFFASALVGGVAFSCKFTAAVALPIFALIWLARRLGLGDRRWLRTTLRVAGGMVLYAVVMAAADVAITGGSMAPISGQSGDHPSFTGKIPPAAERLVRQVVETPIPLDWAGFIRQAVIQKMGGPSYLFGQTSNTGWRHYYLVTLAVKVPLCFWLVMLVRGVLGKRIASAGLDWVLPAAAAAFLALASLGSTRNLGIRYLLPVAPLAIVWISGLAQAGRWSRRIAWAGLAAQLIAVASIHPYELSYFNALAGGPIHGRRILSDSNLDWSQGLKALASLQDRAPELRDLTLYYFGNTEPDRYGVDGRAYTVRAASANTHLPPTLTATTRYLAVSASLQWGTWRSTGFFDPLNGVEPCCYTDDTTIAIYRTADIPALAKGCPRPSGRTPESLSALAPRP